ncbi:MAG: hypothetical protein P8Z31_11880, partial [Gammaproteobacteria bacterium]
MSLIIGSFRQRRSLIDHESAEKGAVNAPLTNSPHYSRNVRAKMSIPRNPAGVSWLLLGDLTR